MSDALPLFPLNTVLYPGITLPLHVFEYRYRTLFDELHETEGPKRFGVVAIRQGLEVGEEEQPVLHDVGCVAEIRRATRHADGRYDAVTLGGPRFHVDRVDDARPYLRASVVYLPEPAGDHAAPLASVALAEFASYWRAVAGVAGDDGEPPALPDDDPVLVSYVLSAALRLDLPEKQELLAIPDATARLRRVVSLLRRETALIAAAPAEVRTEGPFSLN